MYRTIKKKKPRNQRDRQGVFNTIWVCTAHIKKNSTKIHIHNKIISSLNCGIYIQRVYRKYIQHYRNSPCRVAKSNAKTIKKNRRERITIKIREWKIISDFPGRKTKKKSFNLNLNSTDFFSLFRLSFFLYFKVVFIICFYFLFILLKVKKARTHIHHIQ